MSQKILDLLLDQEEVTWKTIIHELIRSEEIDPWDINISLLTQKYIETIKKMQEHDLKISGKILLAAAILLKLKSNHLLENDITRLDNLLNPTEEDIEDEIFEEMQNLSHSKDKQQYTLIPRNPQPRNRKVSINDLVDALQRAMNSKKRILAKMKPVRFEIPKGKVNIMEVIEDIYQKVVYYSKKEDKLTFSRLLPPKAGRYEKVYTFVPLLHLENQHKVEMEQKKAFDEIHVSLQAGKKK